MKWALRIPGILFALFCSFPVLLVLSLLSGLDPWLLMGLHLPGVLIAATMQNLIPHMYRPAGIAGIVLWNVAVFFLLGSGLYGLIAAIFMVVMQIITLAISHRFDGDFMNMGLFAAGAILHGVAYITLFMSGWHESIPLLSTSLILYLGYCFLMLNHTSMRGASGISKRPPAGILAGNRLLSIGFLLLALLFMNIALLKTLFGDAMIAVITFILWIIALLTPEESAAGPSEGGMGDMNLGMEKASQMAPWLEWLLRIVGILLFAFAAVMLVILVYKALSKLIRRLIAAMGGWLRTSANTDMEEYEEERSFLLRARTDKTLVDKGPSLLQRLLYRAPKWKDLDNRGRVRFVVQQRFFPKKEPAKNPSLTAKEALGERLIPLSSLYDKARYSDLPISDQEAEDSRQYLP